MYGLNKNRMAILNKLAVMKILYKEKQASKKHLAQKLDLSIPAISKILQSLENKSYLTSTGKLQNTYGRHQGFWSISPQKDTYLCINFSPRMMKFLVVDACLNPISQIISEDIDLRDFDQIIHYLENKIKYFQREHPFITKIAIECHGIIDFDKGISTLMPRLSHKEQYPILEKLQQRISIPIKIDNSCNVYALAEKWLGLGDNFNNYIWINLDRGVGGAIIFDDELYRGKNFTAGELGHLEIIEDGLLCECGGKGCLEAYLNTQTILKQWQQYHPSAKNLTSLFQAIQNDDENAIKILENIVHYLKKGISPIISLLNPQHIFLGGYLIKAGNKLLTELQKTLYTAPIYKLHYKNDISFSQLSEEELLAGAAFLWIESELIFDQS